MKTFRFVVRAANGVGASKDLDIKADDRFAAEKLASADAEANWTSYGVPEDYQVAFVKEIVAGAEGKRHGVYRRKKKAA